MVYHTHRLAANKWTDCIKTKNDCLNDLDTFGGRQPQPGNGNPSEPKGQGASSPGTPFYKMVFL